MQVHLSPSIFEKATSLAKNSEVVLTIGNFDGVHRGHQNMFEHIRRECPALPIVVLTFDPHPTTLFVPEKPKPQIYTLHTRVAMLLHYCDRVLVQKFDRNFAELSPAEFLQICFESLNVSAVAIGRDFRFGKNRDGDLKFLSAFCETRGIKIIVAPTASSEGKKISSSLIRESLQNGKVEHVEKLLGRPYFLEGVVSHGDKVARTLGWPTANLSWHNELTPGAGIYAGAVELLSVDEGNLLPAVISCGYRPMLGDNLKLQIEAHIFNFSKDIYGTDCRFYFYKFLRSEKKFVDNEQLKLQIKGDIADAEAYILKRK